MKQQAILGSTRFYIIIAIILGIITYVEFAIVEYQGSLVLSPGEVNDASITLWMLYILSIVKFILVILFFMHLWGDAAILQQFFSGGLVIGGGTVAIMLFLFLATNMNDFRPTNQQVSVSHGGGHGGGHGEEAHVEIPERSLAEEIASPAPKSQAATLTPTITNSPNADMAVNVSDDMSEGVGDEAEGGEEAEGFDWQALGETTYTSVCLACHQMTGEGIPGAFPPLKGHASKLYQAEAGRDYLINVALYGLQGELTIAGMTYNSVMAPQGHLDDATVAAVLNYAVTAWGNDEGLENFTPILPEEVAAQRTESKSSMEVYELRPAGEY